ncbi:Uma2 family endonuclease [Streptomyces sp. ST2-7A]|uniref:Uma2 family endonuclease n=1 Tax=Streptomyces sp. ST2-7A TaxID=2907214 RepID=UPI001F176B15|nr:Uma2 family endonuclease [Streptomyces sp. ST2-7A]MCE7078739.1 Uma2 family endonuclease [Streptomyces sp. ST2-7A]
MEVPRNGPEPLPAWAVPPPGGFTAEALDRIPDLPPHTELIDGSLVFAGPQRKYHMHFIRLLEYGLPRSVPPGFEVLREFDVILAPRQRPVPDLMVGRSPAGGEDDGDRTACRAEDVVLVVEVVSPESEDRDRETKPMKYARAGIRHFWRVERGEDGNPVVYVYELDRAGVTYAISGIHHDRLKLSVPFDIDIDIALTAIDRL